jgi:hypothetical protein
MVEKIIIANFADELKIIKNTGSNISIEIDQGAYTVMEEEMYETSGKDETNNVLAILSENGIDIFPKGD